MISALLICALEEGLIDATLLSGWRKDKPWRCEPYIATNREEVLKAIRTGMMIVPNNALLDEAVRKHGFKKVAVVGLPCHIHGLRKLQDAGRPKLLADAIQFTLGLFCAATYYWEGTRHLLQEFGKIDHIEDIQAMDYRGGEPPGGMYVVTTDGKIRFVASKHDYVWHLLGPASFKRDRCLMCVDFSAELADVSCGDIFQKLGPGGSQVATIVRTEIGERLVRLAQRKGYIHLEDHDPQLVPSSGMGWESKKHAGVYRLLQRKRYNWPTPDYGYAISQSPLPRDLSFPK
jgi:coenzyme F420 hydrogenase subunit beta